MVVAKYCKLIICPLFVKRYVITPHCIYGLSEFIGFLALPSLFLINFLFVSVWYILNTQAHYQTTMPVTTTFQGRQTQPTFLGQPHLLPFRSLPFLPSLPSLIPSLPRCDHQVQLADVGSAVGELPQWGPESWPAQAFWYILR